jgi:predicted permease
MDTLLQDLRFAARSLRRVPLFSLGAILTIALGIGGTTAIFSVVHTVLLRPLPFGGGERLVRVQQTVARPDGSLGRVGISQLNFAALRERSRSIESVVAHRFRSFTTPGEHGAEAARVVAIQVSDGWQRTVRVAPALGRTFSADEERAGPDARVAVISDALWRRRYGGAPDVLGRSLTLNGAPHTIIGVMPPGYAYPYGAELWVPMAIDVTAGTPRDMNVTARLRPGVTGAALAAELDRLGAELRAEHAANREMAGFAAIPMRTELVGDFGRVLLALLGAVAFVLLIACANVANLLLSRAHARRHEMAIRAALGAARRRIVRQLLVESTLLAIVGGGLGLLLTLGLVEWLGALIPESLGEVIAGVGIDGRVLAFTLGLSLLTGVAFGLVPAWRASSPNLVDALKSGGRGSSGGLRLLHALVVAEIAVAVVLLAGGGLLLRDLERRLSADLGIVTAGAISMNVALPEAEYADAARRAELVRQLEERLTTLPGVRAAGVTTILPFGSGNTLASVEIAGRAGDARQTVNHRLVTPGFFPALGIRLLRGRLLDARDDARAAPVVVISEAMARRYWPAEDPIGRLVRHAGSSSPASRPWHTVIGVVSDVAENEIPETWYLPYAQGTVGQPVSWSTLRVVLVARATGDPAALVPAMRRAVEAVDPGVPVFDVASLETLHASELAGQRLSATLTGSFALLGLLLAAVGIYGVVSYATSRRTREIGIRMALGAERGVVLRHELARSGGVVLAGLGLGLAGALIVARLMRGLLAEVAPHDPVTLASVSLLLAAVGMLAAYLPARRAARVDPAVVLRPE